MTDVAPATLAYRGTEIAAAVHGELWPANPQRPVSSIVIDSRDVVPHAMFVALEGERADGHDFIGAAAEAGAGACLVRRAVFDARAEELRRYAGADAMFYVMVDNPLRALQNLAAHHLRRMSNLQTIAVTGSNGKTTTKELIAAILGRISPTMANEGNLNSETGLPLSCFRVREEHRIGVFEMGMNHLGEIADLARIVLPSVAIITNIGMAHIGFCGSQDAIAREKKGVFGTFTGEQTAFLPASDRYFDMLAGGVRGRVVPFGPEATRGYEGSESLGLDGNVIHWEGLRIRFPLVGYHNVLNAMAAISVAAEHGVPPAEIRDGLEDTRPLPGRFQILRGRSTVLADCYNSSPESVERLLDFLRDLRWPGRSVGVFGSMLELGDHSLGEHKKLGPRVMDAPFDSVCFFGSETETSAAEARRYAPDREVFWTDSHEALGRRLHSDVAAGDLVVLKGSRGMELERHLGLLTSEGGA